MTRYTKQQVAAALEKSIVHWEEIVKLKNYLEAHVGPGACALCGLFWIGQPWEEKCRDCPVQQRTGKYLCKSTPYEKIHHARTNKDEPAFRRVARAEVKFLKSLREKRVTTS